MEFAFIEREAFEWMAEVADFRAARRSGSYDRAPFDAAQSPVMKK